MQKLTKEQRQPPVVILQQTIFSDIFFCVPVTENHKKSDQGV